MYLTGFHYNKCAFLTLGWTPVLYRSKGTIKIVCPLDVMLKLKDAMLPTLDDIFTYSYDGTLVYSWQNGIFTEHIDPLTMKETARSFQDLNLVQFDEGSRYFLFSPQYTILEAFTMKFSCEKFLERDISFLLNSGILDKGVTPVLTCDRVLRQFQEMGLQDFIDFEGMGVRELDKFYSRFVEFLRRNSPFRDVSIEIPHEEFIMGTVPCSGFILKTKSRKQYGIRIPSGGEMFTFSFIITFQGSAPNLALINDKPMNIFYGSPPRNAKIMANAVKLNIDLERSYYIGDPKSFVRNLSAERTSVFRLLDETHVDSSDHLKIVLTLLQNCDKLIKNLRDC